MFTGILIAVGLCIGIIIVVGLAGVGFACSVMHGLRWIADKVKWVLRIEPKN